MAEHIINTQVRIIWPNQTIKVWQAAPSQGILPWSIMRCDNVVNSFTPSNHPKQFHYSISRLPLFVTGEIEEGLDHLCIAVVICDQPQQRLMVLQQTLPTTLFIIQFTSTVVCYRWHWGRFGPPVYSGSDMWPATAASDGPTTNTSHHTVHHSIHVYRGLLQVTLRKVWTICV